MKLLRRCLLFFLELAAAIVITVLARSFLTNRAAPSPHDVQVTGTRPQLAFACQSSAAELPSIFTPHVIEVLQQLHAAIGLSVGDFSPERTQIVRQLNTAGIPVAAWLALPADEGYYFNAANAPAAAAQFAAFEAWTKQNGLQWERVGLDIEPSMQDFNAVLQGHPFSASARILRRTFDPGAVSRARGAYEALIAHIESDGFAVDTCQFPFLADARKIHATVLERISGIVDVRGNREVFMTYTSFNPAMDSALVWEYGRETQAVAVGVTTGDLQPGVRFGPLTWEAFTHDLIVGSHFSSTVGVFSLEGCIRRGYLDRLPTLDWTQTVTIPAEAMGKVQALRARIQAVLWTLAHLPYIAALLLLANLAILLRRYYGRPGGHL
jgi:hypothetical protein